MLVRCPHCRRDNDWAEGGSAAAITCASCGSTFRLCANEATWDHESAPDTAQTQTHRTATKTIGHFQLVEQLGMGSFGAVWKAKDIELDRLVAVKIPRKDRLSEQETDSFLREARAAGQLRHPNIVPVHQVGCEEDVVYIVSDYIDGAPLSDWMTARRPSAREVAQLCITIARALQHAHDQGVIHRDLKPGNIMMDMAGEPHLMDFGLARREVGEVTMTIEGQVLGTPAYMSPEQARGESHNADQRSDIYSVGVMLFRLLTDELPFRGSARMLMVQIVQDDAPSLRKLSNHVPADLDTICLKCLEKDPDRRFQSADELASELERFVNGEPIRSRPISSLGRGWRWCKRRPALATVSALLAVVTIVGFGGVTWQWRRAEDNFDASQWNLREANSQRARAVENFKEANDQRARAEENFGLARKTVHRMLTQVPNHELLRKPGMENLKADLQGLACEYYAELASQQLEDPKLKMEQGQAHFFYAMTLDDIGKTDEAMLQYEAARDAFLDARKRQAAIGPDEFVEQRLAQNLAASYGNIAGLKMMTGELDEGIAAFEGILAIQQRLMEKQPDELRHRVDVIVTLMNIMFIERDQGRLDSALERNRQALALTQATFIEDRADNLNTNTLRSYQPMLQIEIGFIELQRENLELALKAYENAATTATKLAKAEPNQLDLHKMQGIAERGSAAVLARLQRFEEADERWERAVASHRYAFENAPEVVQYRNELANTYGNYALYWQQREQPVNAAELLIQQTELESDAGALFGLACAIGECLVQFDDSLDPAIAKQSSDRERIATEAIAVLNLAIDQGFSDVEAFESAGALKSIRDHPAYKALGNKLRAEQTPPAE